MAGILPGNPNDPMEQSGQAAIKAILGMWQQMLTAQGRQTPNMAGPGLLPSANMSYGPKKKFSFKAGGTIPWAMLRPGYWDPNDPLNTNDQSAVTMGSYPSGYQSSVPESYSPTLPRQEQLVDGASQLQALMDAAEQQKFMDEYQRVTNPSYEQMFGGY